MHSKHIRNRLWLPALMILALLPWGVHAGPNAGAQHAAPQRHDPEELVEIRPEQFGGVDVCLRDTSGETNICSRTYGIIKETGGEPERICQISGKALEALKRARAELKKTNPNLELIVISSYRSPGHQQCLWVKKTDAGFSCNSAVCGPADPKSGARLPCREYDLMNPRYSHIFDHCPHVNRSTVDLCAYDRTRVKLNKRNQLDMTILDDCRKASDRNHKLEDGFYYHPCTCRFTSWTNDIRNASPRTKIFTHGGADEQQAMIKAMRKTGWTDNAPGEWWHFKYIRP